MGISVLVVDANVENGKHIKNSLEASNLFQVTLATRAIEALMRFTETRFQVAIIDFGLPDLNGADLIRQIRGIDESAIIVAVLKDSKTKPPEIKKLPVNLILDKPAHLSYLQQYYSLLLMYLYQRARLCHRQGFLRLLWYLCLRLLHQHLLLPGKC